MPVGSGISSTPEAGLPRRHDVDSLRVFALGLLIVYHIVVSFQPWAFALFFIQNKEPIEGLWTAMSMVNVWRIPILFLVSGMGVRFAMERRDWKQLLTDRTVRILVPLVFGFFFICPISILIALNYYGEDIAYIPNAGHLWFLGNIFLYVLLLLPLLVYLKKNTDGWFFNSLTRLFQIPLALLLVALPLMAEAWLLDPSSFVQYAMTAHGFWLGMLCFLMGFIFISLGDVFWQAIERNRFFCLAIALGLFVLRIWLFKPAGEMNTLLAFESTAWMLAILGFGSRYLNRPSSRLAYLSKAVYPVYILHMPIQFGLSYLIIPLGLPAVLKLVLIMAGTFAICLLMYEFLIRRVRFIQPLFGVKLRAS